MAVAKTFCAQLIGLEAHVVTIEVDISNGLNNFSIVGLGDRSVNESKDRIAAAIKNSGFTSPKQKNQKVVISLAPADIKKEGSSYDLGMALAYLKAAGDVTFDSTGKLFLGELTLEGEVRRITGLLPILCQAKSLGFEEIYIPKDNTKEASLARDLRIYTIGSLTEVIAVLNGDVLPEQLPLGYVFTKEIEKPLPWPDMNIIRGNEAAKRAMEVAAAGAHNIIMNGPPGTGKTMLAQSFNSILPALTYGQAVEVTSIHSAAKTLEGGLVFHPPFRSPHHTASYPSIVGGGSFPRPGEITLAHRGVLFMDEFPEFSKEVIEALRQPLEDKVITISRAKGTVTFPAQCILLASMNPCPCGKGKDHGCICKEHQVLNYYRKLSGPILDRFDIWIGINKIDYEKMSEQISSAESSSSIRKRVQNARTLQEKRFQLFGINKFYNSEMTAKDIERCVTLDDEAKNLLKVSAAKFSLSARAFHRVMKVGRTVADLANSHMVTKAHILEALQYRERRQ